MRAGGTAMSTRASQSSWPEIYRERRNRIRKDIGGGAILWMGHELQPRNFPSNTYPFRQNSHFLYYTGLTLPDMAVLSFPERDHDVLFAKPESMDDIVWSGSKRSPAVLAADAGIEKVEDLELLEESVSGIRSKGMNLHFLPPYQYASLSKLSRLMNAKPDEVIANVSQKLMKQVAGQRSIKSDIEIAEIEEALAITDQMHRACMAAARPGVREREIAGLIQGIALSDDREQAFTPIVTVRGEVLHNHSYDGVLEAGQLLLCDSGAESRMYYASDTTRTSPVGGRFSPVQAEVYEIVLRVQLEAIAMMKPGVTNREVHLGACRVLAEGLCGMGLMKGKASDAVEAGAHALFFPHGIGHMLGLDVHDMEDLGDIVGYKDREKRSGQFGLNALRLSRPLEPGYVLTAEPGIYFIPALMDRWQQEGKHKEFINYEKAETFRNFGGIRIEDDILITATGSRILGPPIPKTVSEVEEACSEKIANYELRISTG
jgi:Xaa-Pro aminopeptidase